MNALSWLIYAASVTNSAGNFFSFLAFVGAVIAIIGFIFSVVFTDSHKEELRNKYAEFNRRGAPLITRGLALLIIGGLLASALPDKNTVYAIAASEVGDRLTKTTAVTDIGQEALETLKVWLRAQREPKSK